MITTSVIIPARNEQFLSVTIDDLIKKAKGEIEVIAILDGYWPNPPLQNYPNLIIIHNTISHGMRPAINDAVKIARGKYIMKCDAHCIFDEGYDIKLAENCDETTVAIPPKYSIDYTNWSIDQNKTPWHYFYLTYPYEPTMYGAGLHAKNHNGSLNEKRKDILIDDIMSFQGSCWFMHKSFFENTIGPLDHENYYFYQEAQEIGFKAWLSGGRVIINKNTWYGHLHKGKVFGRGYYLDLRKKRSSEAFAVDFWMNNKWSKQTRSFEWLIDKFWDILPGWPVDWKDEKYKINFEKGIGKK